MDWNLVRTFVAVAEAGSLSGAVDVVGASQPTLGRHIAQLESELGVTLFARHARGLTLTEEGTALFERGVRVREEVAGFERRGAGLDPGLEGTVRVTASQIVASYVLPEMIRDIREAHPGVELEVVAEDRTTNLLRRDADIAIRMYQPRQQGLIARKIADSGLGLYASRAYLDRHGPVERFAPDGSHTLLGFDRDGLGLELLERMGQQGWSRGAFQVRSDAQPFHVQAVVAGVGVGALQHALARRLPGLVEVLPGVVFPSLPVWLVAHEDVRRSVRVRAVYDLLAEGLGAFYGDGPG
jgi:DNA-binding transcriptional LysR family regulator